MAGEHCPHVPEGFCPDCLPGQGATIDDEYAAGRYHLLWCLETFPDASDSDRDIIHKAIAKQARLDLIKERAQASKKSV